MRLFLALLVSIFLFVVPARACEFCTIINLGQKKQSEKNNQHRWSAKVFYENQNWDEIPAVDAHQLHHQGHHAHDKQDEQIIHTMLTGKISEKLSVDVDIPYVTRNFIEIDSHAHLGENQVSKGIGDTTITLDYRFIQDKEKSVGVIAGVKAPTGKTKENNSFGGLIEPELQPGTGSVDYIAGLAGALHQGTLDFSMSAIYIYKTEGHQDFRFGDTLSVSFFGGKNFVLIDDLNLNAGIMLNNQLEKKQNNRGGFIKDSGGYTMLVGPQIDFNYKQAALSFSYLTPAVQELGGVHQQLDGIWTGSLGLRF